MCVAGVQMLKMEQLQMRTTRWRGSLVHHAHSKHCPLLDSSDTVTSPKLMFTMSFYFLMG